MGLLRPAVDLSRVNHSRNKKKKKINDAEATFDYARWSRGARQKREGALPMASPLPEVNPTKSVVQQIKQDVNTVISEFSSLPAMIQNVLKTALNAVMNQSIYKLSVTDQFNSISTSIKNQLAKVQQSLPTTLSAISAMDDTGNVAALEQCINTIVAMGGRRSEEDGTCLSTSGYSLDSLKSQFDTFVDVNQFVVPANAANDGNASESIRNVLLSVAAKDRDASESAFDCWIKAIQMISSQSLAERQLQCDTGMDGTSGVKGSTLEDIEEAYISQTNQFLGVLPPALAANIQAIGISKLTLNVGSFDASVRDNINSAILSATAATSGESASLVYSLIDCLNTIYDDTPDEQCNPNANPEILDHNKNVYYNYLAQFVSTLPKVLVQSLNSTVEGTLESGTYANADSLRSQIEDLFATASLGTEYEACEREFTDCVVAAMVAGTATTTCTENKGTACQNLPPLAAQPIDSSSPYGGIAAGLQGAGQLGSKKHRRSSRRVVA